MSEQKQRQRNRRKPKSDKQLFTQDPLIYEGYTQDLDDNLYYGHYSTRFLEKIHKQGVDTESPSWRSAYRSFEGEVFENFVYERLLRYVRDHDEVKHFIAKIPGTRPKGDNHTALMLNKKGQIVYRVRYRDLGEFDALIFTDKELYFVEMTLVSSVNNLRDRLPKKRALLQLLFPRYDVRALMVLEEGVTGLSTLPNYCSVWKSKGVDSTPIFKWIAGGKKGRLKKFQKTSHEKFVTPSDIEVRTFQYYATLSWLLHSLQGKNGNPLNVAFFKSKKFKRFHDLLTKVVIGTMSADAFALLHPDAPPCEPFVYVAIEKEPLGGSFLTYFNFKGPQNLLNIRIKRGEASAVKKDPKGITVTELKHLSRHIDPTFDFSISDIKIVEKILEEENRDLGYN